MRVQGVRGSHTATITGGEIDVGEISIGGSARFEDQTDLLDVSNVSIDSLINIQSSGTGDLVHTATFNASQSTLAGSIQVGSSRGTAVVRQTGGTAAWNTMRVYSDKTLGADYSSTYVIDGADVTVVGKFYGGDPTYYNGTIDFENSAGTLRFKDAAYADLTAITFANQSNASLVLGDEILVRVRPGQEVGTGFGRYTPNRSVVHEAGSDLVIERGESVRVRPELDIEEHVVVRGLLRDQYKNGLQLNGGLEVDGGFVRLQDRGSVVAFESSPGVHVNNGGLLQVRDVSVRREGGTAMTLDSGRAEIARNLFVAGGTLQINGGELEARYIDYAPYRGENGRFVQNGGTVRAQQLTFGEYALNDGELVTELTNFAGYPFHFTQNGGRHETQTLSIDGQSSKNAVYELSAGTLAMNEGRMRIGEYGTLSTGPDPASINLTSSALIIDPSARLTGSGATLNLDEHSMLVAPAGKTLPFSEINQLGMTWDGVSDLTIPEGRDIVYGGSFYTVADPRINVEGTLRALPTGGVTSNVVINGGTLDLSNNRIGRLSVQPGHAPVINSGTMIGGVAITRFAPHTFTHNGGNVIANSIVVQRDDGNVYKLNGGALRITEFADFRRATGLSNDGTNATLTAASGSHVDFFFGLNPGAVSGVDLIVERNALVTFAAGYDYNAEFNSVTNNGLIHEDGTTLVIPEGTEIVAGTTASNAAIGIDGDVVLNGTLAMRGYNRSTGSSLIIEDGLTFGETATIDIGIAWNEPFEQLEWQRLDYNADASDQPMLDGELRISFDNQVYLDGDEELHIINGLFSGGTFNDGAERVVTTDGEGSFLIEYRDYDGVYLTDYMPYRPFGGDLNLDREVDQEDLDLVLANLNSVVDPGDALAGDLTGDGITDEADLQVVLNGWTDDVAPVIPEPSSLAIMSGLIGIGLRRQNR